MTVANPDSILDSVKQALGLTPDATQFDLDVIMHINAVIGTLQQLGVNDNSALYVADDSTHWTAITGRQDVINFIKTYTFMRVRHIFDPPASGFALQANEKVIEELAWRINVMAESTPTAISWWILDGFSDFPAVAPVGAWGIDFSTGNVYTNGTSIETPFMWDLTGLSDFPVESSIGDFGFDSTTGNVWRRDLWVKSSLAVFRVLREPPAPPAHKDRPAQQVLRVRSGLPAHKDRPAQQVLREPPAQQDHEVLTQASWTLTWRRRQSR